METLDDDALMLRLQAGERAAFDQLVERHQSSLLGFFFHQCRDAQLAEDLTQETLLRLFQQSWDFLPRGKFRGWLYRIARNLHIDHHRKRSHDALLHAVQPRDPEREPLQQVVDEMVGPDVHADRREIARIVEQALPTLPSEQRETFTLYHYQGLSLPDIADAMETSVSTTKSRLRLAREKLREHLAAHGIQITDVEV